MTGRPEKRKQSAERVQKVSPPPVKRKVQSTANKHQVASFFTPTSQKAPSRTTWRTIEESVLVARYRSNPDNEKNTPSRTRIAAFDFDSTLIVSASGRTISKDTGDWKWWDPSIPTQLRKLYDDGYQLIIITNQGRMNLNKDTKTAKSDGKRISDFKNKVNAVLESLDLPVSVYAATQKDLYRKPRTGTWKEMLDDYDFDESGNLNLNESFFVGDAAGRQGDGDGMGRKDFACSDRDFAANVGIKFMTPEEYFLKAPVRSFKRVFDPSQYLRSLDQAPEQKPPPFSKTNMQDIVVLCGSPGVGKSTFFWTYLKPVDYERVNQDMLKSREKCMAIAEQLLVNGKSVAVDNTNADKETRSRWVKLAERLKLPIRCVHLKGDSGLCEHNDTVRALNRSLMNPEARTMLPTIAFASFASRFNPPTPGEGFQDITTVEFEFYGTEEQRAIWSRFWI